MQKSLQPKRRVSKIEIKFHKQIYPSYAVKQAVRDFKDITKVGLKDKNNYYLVSIDNSDPAKELMIKGNFLNYVLILSRPGT